MKYYHLYLILVPVGMANVGVNLQAGNWSAVIAWGTSIIAYGAAYHAAKTGARWHFLYISTLIDKERERQQFVEDWNRKA